MNILEEIKLLLVNIKILHSKVNPHYICISSRYFEQFYSLLKAENFYPVEIKDIYGTQYITWKNYICYSVCDYNYKYQIYDYAVNPIEKH